VLPRLNDRRARARRNNYLVLLTTKVFVIIAASPHAAAFQRRYLERGNCCTSRHASLPALGTAVPLAFSRLFAREVSRERLFTAISLRKLSEHFGDREKERERESEEEGDAGEVLLTQASAG